MSADPQPLFFILVTSRAVWKLLKVVFVDDKIKHLILPMVVKLKGLGLELFWTLI